MSENNLPQPPQDQRCPRCEEPLAPNENGEWTCPRCAERQQLLWILGIALLFFCFVVLPMMVQFIGTPPPPR